MQGQLSRNNPRAACNDIIPLSFDQFCENSPMEKIERTAISTALVMIVHFTNLYCGFAFRTSRGSLVTPRDRTRWHGS